LENINVTSFSNCF